jgi:hypothetical protein
MLLIGDVHRSFDDYREIVKRSQEKSSLQLGDFGLGFPIGPDHLDMSDIEGQHLFIRGNHDNPAICKVDPNYAGDFGIIEDCFIGGRYTKLFFISGAWSIDQHSRTPGMTWWHDEELSFPKLNDAVNLYIEEQPEIVCSHCCPTIAFIGLELGYNHYSSRTVDAMNEMFLNHRPAMWIFAHHHTSKNRIISGTIFRCLNELEIFTI